MAHEAGHLHLSRYGIFDVPFPSQPALHFVLNTIEDPRVEAWMMQAFPGTQRFIAAAGRAWRSTTSASDLPWFLRFGLECVMEPDREWLASPHADRVPRDVVSALATTREARRAYALSFPDWDVSPASSWDRYRAEALPRLAASASRTIPEHRERVIRLGALHALRMLEGEVLPTALGLFMHDRARIAAALARSAVLRRRVSRALAMRGDNTRTLLLDALAEAPTIANSACDAAHGRLAQQLLDAALGEEPARGETSRKGGFRPPVSKGGGRAAGSCARKSYETIRAEVGAQVQALVDGLTPVVRPPVRSVLQGGHASGPRADLRCLMRREADPAATELPWMRRTVLRSPRTDAAFGLLVDLSGSMRGDKVESAAAGVVLLVETLEQLGVRHAVHGFQDELIPIRDVGETLDHVVRSRIAAIAEETTGERRGGHNRPQWNDDGPCLLEAALRLAKQPAGRRVLIVISDGEPEGRRSGAHDLRRAIESIEARGEVDLVAIGLGPQTGHVHRYYRHAVANVRIPDLSREIAAVLQRSIAA
jgi:hypothetical protein